MTHERTDEGQEMIAVLGTGSMGSAVVERLLQAGWDVIVWNRTPEKTAALVDLGADAADSPSSALRRSSTAIVALADAAAVRRVLLSEDCAPELAGRDLLNISYTTVAEVQQLAEDVGGLGGTLSEVNVTVYPDLVRRGEGHFNLAAAPGTTAHWVRVLSDLGHRVHDVGEVGNASKAEMALWLSFMLTPVAIAYAMAAFERLRLPAEALRSALTENPTLRVAGAEELLPQIIASDYRTDMYSVSNFLSSASVVRDEAAAIGLPTSVFDGIIELSAQAEAMGYADHDIAAIAEALRAHGRGVSP